MFGLPSLLMSTKGQRRRTSRRERDEPCAEVRASLFDEVAELAGVYATALPYTHIALSEVFSEGLLEAVQNEVINNLRATFKETDLFKVYQVPQDIGSLETSAPEVAAKCPSLLKLRDHLYSKKFRTLMEQLTGCGALCDKQDCSVNVYDTGGYLLCHDDVIGTRRLSYIVYLVDKEWAPAEDGGALALYGSDAASKLPEAEPTCRVHPAWNQMVIFQVRPGMSFHSVEEVIGSRPRMSISGWFHSAPDAFDQSYVESFDVARTLQH
jgi:Rps23 Pro-64 3,4-dihydroxylase Tpa1-like proline 4-hydroxylase